MDERIYVQIKKILFGELSQTDAQALVNSINEEITKLSSASQKIKKIHEMIKKSELSDIAKDQLIKLIH